MAKHERPDDAHPWIGPVGMVHYENWSGKFWRKEINRYAYVGEPGELCDIVNHSNTYDSYEEMPVGSVAVVLPLYKTTVRKLQDGRWVKI